MSVSGQRRSFDIKTEKPGPGAASVYDPEFKQRHEGISPRETTSLPHKIAVSIMNDSRVSHTQDYGITEKLKSYPESVRVQYENLHRALQRWQGGGGFSSNIGIAAENYIRGYDPLKSLTRRTNLPMSDASIDYAKHIVDAIRNAPERKGTIYRGIYKPFNEPIESLENAKPGDVLRIDRPSSFSHRLSTARGFLVDNPRGEFNSYRITVVDRYKGLDAKAREEYNNESEVITYGRFKVVHKFTDRKGVKNIVVRQLETHMEDPWQDVEPLKPESSNKQSTLEYLEDFANPHD